MARVTPGGAVVSDDGNWFWSGWRWIELAANPPTDAPGLLSKERRSIPSLVKGRDLGEMKRAGEALAAQTATGQSLVDAEVALNPVQVKHYKDAKEYERDTQTMSAAGWKPQGQTSEDSKVAAGRTLGKAVATGGIGLLLTGRSKKGGGITVTWVRPEAAASPSPTGDDIPSKLRELADLRDKGILTDSEFEAKKAELLSRL